MNNKARSVSLLSLLLAFALMLGCVPALADEAIDAAKDTMTIGCYGATQSLFPGNDGKIPGAQLAVNLYDTLLEMKKDGTIVPLLAESWEQIDDTHYQVVIKKGVKFHNGDELKASDVVFSLTTLCTTAGSKSNTTQFAPEEFKVVDDYTCILATKEAFAPFITTLCHPTMSIFSQSFYEEHLAAGDLDVVENGTGPFKLVVWNEGENILVERFDEYFGEAAKMQYVNFRYIPEANTRLMELEAGGIDLMQEVPGVSLDEVRYNSDLILWESEGVGTSYFALNFDKYPDTKVRLAIAYAIDNDTLRRICLMDGAATLDNYLPDTIPGAYQTGGYPYDPAKAKEMLAEAGYPDGLALELSFYSSSDNRRMGECLQSMLSEAGITLVLNEMDSSAYSPFLNARSQEAAICTTNCTLRDPHQTLSKLYSSLCGSGGNRVNYADETLDQMLDAAAAESDSEKRMALYAELQQYLFENVVYIPLYSLKVCTATTAKIRGFDLEYPASYQRYNTCYFVK